MLRHPEQTVLQKICNIVIGLISPVLANITLDGLEQAIYANAKIGDKIHYVRYADDWVCTATSREILEQQVLPTVVKFLNERGLELSQEKTKITNVNEGFDFLGFNLRKYKGKLLIKPAKKGIKTFLANIRQIIESRRADKTEKLILTLNPKIRGWTNYFRHSVAKKTFSQVDNSIFQALWKWAKKRHSNKSSTWIKKKYFIHTGPRNNFSSRTKEGSFILVKASDTRIIRHVKVRGAATPYDPEYKEYFLKRQKQQMKHGWAMSNSFRGVRAV